MYINRRGELNFALKNYEIRRKRLSSDHPQIAGSLNNIANIHRRKGNYDLALDYYQKTLQIYKRNYTVLRRWLVYMPEYALKCGDGAGRNHKIGEIVNIIDIRFNTLYSKKRLKISEDIYKIIILL
jgi:tetratricopeptide (TPR) repeat protein